MDALEWTRNAWRIFDLNKSPNAGMRITIDGEVVKEYGTNPDTSGMKAFIPEIPLRKDHD